MFTMGREKAFPLRYHKALRMSLTGADFVLFFRNRADRCPSTDPKGLARFEMGPAVPPRVKLSRDAQLSRDPKLSPVLPGRPAFCPRPGAWRGTQPSSSRAGSPVSTLGPRDRHRLLWPHLPWLPAPSPGHTSCSARSAVCPAPALSQSQGSHRPAGAPWQGPRGKPTCSETPPTAPPRN